MKQKPPGFPPESELKDVEEEIVHFYQIIGDLSNLNSKSTAIFAYFQVYDTLTQDDLHNLTEYSKSTISTTLQAFLQSEIIRRENISGSRKYRYRYRPEKATFIYAVFTDIMENLEKFDKIILRILTQLAKYTHLYATETSYLTLRLNSFRNYIEAQRRAILNKNPSGFILENVKTLYPQTQLPSIEFSPEIENIEAEFIGKLQRNNVGTENDPILNKILGYFYSRGSLTQQQLQELTGFSPSTISRILGRNIRNQFIKSYPKSYQKPRVYYLESPALAIIDQILEIDENIFQNEAKFEKTLKSLTKLRKEKRFEAWADYYCAKISDILNKINQFRPDSGRLRQAREDLAHFNARTAR